jgi:cation transport ATPase
MLFYITLFLIFLYFKIARVHKKEERVTLPIILLHVLVLLSTIGIYIYGFQESNIITVLVVSFLYFIVAALIITTIQLGIFIDGKPLLGINRVYKFMPILTGLIVLLTVTIIL